MKSITVLYAVTALAALSFTGQASAKGGSMGGGQNHGSTGVTHQMAATMQSESGNDMQQRTMQSTNSRQRAASGPATQIKKQGRLNASGNQQNGQMNKYRTGPMTTQPSATSATD